RCTRDLGWRTSRRCRIVFLASVATSCGLSTNSTFAAPELVSTDLTLNFSRVFDNDGNVIGYNYGGLTGSLGLTPVDVPFVLNLSITPSKAAQPFVYWSDSFAWDNGLGLLIANTAVHAVAIWDVVTKGELSV